MTLIREETKPVSISQQFSVSPMVIYTHSFKKVSEIKNKLLLCGCRMEATNRRRGSILEFEESGRSTEIHQDISF